MRGREHAKHCSAETRTKLFWSGANIFLIHTLFDTEIICKPEKLRFLSILKFAFHFKLSFYFSLTFKLNLFYAFMSEFLLN